MSGAADRRITRNLVVARWGTPQVTVGSVNEPRETTERGHRFNEMWVYRNPVRDPIARERVVYWLRYDYVASYITNADGVVCREDPAALLAGLEDRAYRPETRGDEHSV